MKSILIVDDNVVTLKQIGAQLAGHYEISLAKSGEVALAICSHMKPDLILLDVEMPGMDGFAVIVRLRQDPMLNQIPVIFITGNNDAATEIKCLEAGAIDFIIKPAHTDILRRRLDMHLEYSTCQLRPESMMKELEDIIGMSFAELVECKDYNVAGHLLRTGAYAELLARELYETGIFGGELAAADIEMIRRAAPFHDIGKIGISDVILLKRGPLNAEEYEEVRKHTTIGAKLLEVIYSRAPNQRYLETAAIMAEGHHERYDGAGYPKGLKGGDIPLCCRIMSVANVYDACVTDRVYRKRLEHEEACRVIISGAGGEFDPQVVEVFQRQREKFSLLHANSHFSSNEAGWSFFHEANIGS